MDKSDTENLPSTMEGMIPNDGVENSSSNQGESEHNTLNPNVTLCFNTTSQDYNIDWPALPGGSLDVEEICDPLSEDINDPSVNELVSTQETARQENPDTFQIQAIQATDGLCRDDDDTSLSFNLYQRQSHIYAEANIHPYPINAHHSVPLSLPPMELQGQLFFNLEHSNQGAPQAHQIFPLQLSHMLQQQQIDGYQGCPIFENYNAVPAPVFYGYPEPAEIYKCVVGNQEQGCSGSGGNDQYHFRKDTPLEIQEEDILPIKIPSWAKLALDEDEENSNEHPPSSYPQQSSRLRLVEYIGDQYHEKNPHTRRTILLNQRRSSDNDPIVLYRFYQFSCPCQGKVWFSPLHRAREGCYCRDCHKFVKPFGHIDGFTPYMGNELCYGKFSCHHCGRSWSCQKSRSNFPDNCFSCGTIVYPYYQVSHSVLRRKIVRQNDNDTIRFRNWTYSGSSSSVDDDEAYQEVLRQPLYFEQRNSSSRQYRDEAMPSTFTIGSNKISSSSEGTRTASVSNVCLLETSQQNQSRPLSAPTYPLGRSLSDTMILLGHHYQRCKGDVGRIGFRHHLHRK